MSAKAVAVAAVEEVKLITADGEILTVNLDVLQKASVTMRDLLTFVKSKSGGEDNIEVPLPKIHSSIMIKVIEWANHHYEMKPTKRRSKRKCTRCVNPYIVSLWDTRFLDCDTGVLCGLIMAADYLQIYPLVEICTKKLTNVIKHMNFYEMMLYFKIVKPADHPASDNDGDDDGDVDMEET